MNEPVFNPFDLLNLTAIDLMHLIAKYEITPYDKVEEWRSSLWAYELLLIDTYLQSKERERRRRQHARIRP